MRFKAKLATEQVQLLSSLIGPISRLTADGGGANASSGALSGLTRGGTVVHLDPDHVRLSTRGGGDGGEGIASFAELTTTRGIFLEHRTESAANNVIVFEIDLAQLRTALQSVLSGGPASERSASQRGRRKGGDRVPTTSTAPHSLYNSSFVQRDREQEQEQPNATTSATPASQTVLPLTSSHTVLKLAKRSGGFPCLCIDASCAGGSVEVHHAIPVRIMRAAEMQ